MKHFRSLIILVSVCLIFSLNAFAQGKNAEQKIYRNIQIEPLTATEQSKFSAEKLESLNQSIPKYLLNTKRFISVNSIDQSSENDIKSVGNEETDSTEKDTVEKDNESVVNKLKITGEVTKFEKGSRLLRYLSDDDEIGATKIYVSVKFTDIETGEIIFAEVIVGEVSDGIFGGSSKGAINGVADSIINVMRRKKIVGKKIK